MAALLIPAVTVMAIFLIGPIVSAAIVSLTNQGLTGFRAANYQSVGLANYVSVLTSSGFLHSAVITFYYLILSVLVGQTCVGLAAAYLVRYTTPRGQLLRFLGHALAGSLIAAWIVPQIVCAILWLVLGQQNGVIDQIIKPLGLGHIQLFSRFPLVLVSAATVWNGAALSMLIFSAGLRSMSEDLLECAQIDGANKVQSFLYVQIPLLRRTLAVNFILCGLNTFANFTLIFALTAGGPGTATQTLPQYAYQTAFSFSQLGTGNAIAIIMVAIAALAGTSYALVLRDEV